MSAQKKQTTNDLNNYHCFMQEFLSNHIFVPDILLDQYQQLRLSEADLVQLLRIIKKSKDWGAFTIQDVMDEFAAGANLAQEILVPFIEKGLISSITTAEQKIYSFDGLFKELSEIWFYAKSTMINGKKAPAAKSASPQRKNTLGNLYQAFEKEFGRGLSPIENDKLTQWLENDNISCEVIMEALRRAVLQGKTTFNYIDRILLNWQKQNLHTVKQIEENDRHPAAAALKDKKRKSVPKSPYNSVYDSIFNQ